MKIKNISTKTGYICGNKDCGVECYGLSFLFRRIAYCQKCYLKLKEK